jgi:hypothetical protein
VLHINQSRRQQVDRKQYLIENARYNAAHAASIVSQLPIRSHCTCLHWLHQLSGI